MSEPAARLPARPSIEQLRKRAKERLDVLRAADPTATLSDAQLAIARAYGFDSWPKLVHHIEDVQASGRLDRFARVATDYVSAYVGDVEAIDRLIAHYGVSYNREQAALRVRSRVDDALGTTGVPTLEQVQGMIAREHGFDSWAAFAEALAQPSTGTATSPLGFSETPPFYRIDWKNRTMMPQGPLSDRDWDTIFAVMREHRLTGIESSAVTDSAMRRLAELELVTRINIGGAQQMTDDGLLHLAAMPHLEELEAGGWHSPFTDRGLAVLQHLPALRKFHCYWAQRISDAGASHLTF